jgi:hypothetical protein
MLAVGSGDVWVNDYSGSRTLRSHNVLHVLRVASNIISVRGLLMCGLHVVYELDSVRVSLPGRFSISGTWDRDAYRIPSTAVCARVRTSSSSDIRLWHRRFGHTGFGNLSRLGVEDMVTGFPTDISDEDWKFARREICQTCLILLQSKVSYHIVFLLALVNVRYSLSTWMSVVQCQLLLCMVNNILSLCSMIIPSCPSSVFVNQNPMSSHVLSQS